MSKKKKILVATAFPTHGAGSGALVTTQAKSYVEDGHKVVIITGNNRTNFDKLDGVKYHIVPFKSEGKNPEKIDGQCDFNYLMFTTHTESTANFWNVGLNELEQYCKSFKNALSEEVKRLKPDVIHAQHNWLLSSEATRIGIPVVTTVHGTDLMGYEKSKNYLNETNQKLNKLGKSPIISKLEEIYNDEGLDYKEVLERTRDVVNTLTTKEEGKIAQKAIKLLSDKRKYEFYISEAENSARNSNKIIVISDAQKDKFCNLFPYASGKVELLENGYDPKTFYVDKSVNKEKVFEHLESNLAETGKIPTDYSDLILFVGKFADFKGIDSLLIANKLYEKDLKEKGKNPLTVIVGSGDLEQKLKNQAEQLGLENTHFVGRKNHDTIRQLQNLSTVSLIPSRNEPFGLVVIEGTACGHPVIGSNSGGIPGIMNISKKELPKDDVIQTPLGVLIRPLPERPQVTDAKKEILDSQNIDYVLGDEDSRNRIASNLSSEINISEEEIKKYYDDYMASTQALAQAVVKVCDGELIFDNEKIAEYTKKVYSQEKIREKLLKIFDNAEKDYDNSER